MSPAEDISPGWRFRGNTKGLDSLHNLTCGVEDVVRVVGIEPTLLAEPDFESGASTSSTTPVRGTYIGEDGFRQLGYCVPSAVLSLHLVGEACLGPSATALACAH